MHWNSIPPDYAVKAIAAKALARRNCSFDNFYKLAGVLMAAATAALILLWDPFFFDKSKPWLVLALAAVGIGGYCIAKLLVPMKVLPAVCPNCSHDWTIREGIHVPYSERMLTWDKCPGCGSLMNEEFLRMAIDKQPSK